MRVCAPGKGPGLQHLPRHSLRRAVEAITIRAEPGEALKPGSKVHAVLTSTSPLLRDGSAFLYKDSQTGRRHG